MRQVARFAIGSRGSLGLALAGPVSSVPAVMATVHPTVAEYLVPDLVAAAQGH